MKSCNPETGGYSGRFACEVKLQRLKTLPNALNRGSCLRFVDVGKNHQKFLSSQAATDVRLPSIRLEHLSEPLKNGIAKLMSIGIVNSLKIVEVGHHHPEWKMMPGCCTDLAACPQINSAAVWQAGQRICQRQLLELTILGLELSVQINHPASYSHASHEFTRMEWFRQIVIRTSRQPFDHLLFVGIASHQDEICIVLLKVATYPLTQFNSANIRHRPVRDDEGRAMFSKEIERLATIFRKQ